MVKRQPEKQVFSEMFKEISPFFDKLQRKMNGEYNDIDLKEDFEQNLKNDGVEECYKKYAKVYSSGDENLENDIFLELLEKEPMTGDDFVKVMDNFFKE